MKSHLIWLWCGLMVFSGCSYWDVLKVRSQSPDDSGDEPSKTRLVGDLAVPFGMFPVRAEAIGLVTGLRSTGSDPAPSIYRAALLDEMQTRSVKKPNQVLASTDTALVLIRGVLRPGIQKGDRFDVEIRIPSRSDTTSLRGGFLLETRLKEMALLNNQFHEGHLLALARGPVLVDPSADTKDDKASLGRGRILGGGVALKSRPLKLVLKPGKQNVANSARVQNVVNKRFHTFRNGIKVGVAKAETDKSINLIVHPRYKDNVARYVQVVRAVALRESTAARIERIGKLEEQLLDPITSSAAALQLEAIGSDGAEPLLSAVKSQDPEVRFYAAEALAYLDQREAAGPLGEAARNEPAFRVFALTALSAMDDYLAYEQLRDLLSLRSAETRYGAFRALWAMNPNDSLVLGEQLGGQFSYHVLGTTGPAMIHITRNRRPEIVLFGQDQEFLAPLAVDAGNQIMVTGCGPGEIAVSKYSAGNADQKRVVSTQVDEVIRTIVELGGTYPDVVQALQEAKAAGALSGRLEVDAVPKAGRTYDRVANNDHKEGDSAGGQRRLASPLPELFPHRRDMDGTPEGSSRDKSGETGPNPSDSKRGSHRIAGFFARMMGRDSDDAPPQ